MTDDVDRLRSLELIVAAGEMLPISEFEQLSVGSQVSLESRMRAELESLAGELGPEGLDVVIKHLEGLLAELVAGGAPGEMIVDTRQTIERLRQCRAKHN